MILQKNSSWDGSVDHLFTVHQACQGIACCLVDKFSSECMLTNRLMKAFFLARCRVLQTITQNYTVCGSLGYKKISPFNNITIVIMFAWYLDI